MCLRQTLSSLSHRYSPDFMSLSEITLLFFILLKTLRHIFLISQGLKCQKKKKERENRTDQGLKNQHTTRKNTGKTSWGRKYTVVKCCGPTAKRPGLKQQLKALCKQKYYNLSCPYLAQSSGGLKWCVHLLRQNFLAHNDLQLAFYVLTCSPLPFLE